MEEPVLMMPDQSKPFQIESDASKVATGTVLTQLDSNGDRHPVAFMSKTFSDTKRKYEIYDRELLGIIRALKEWRHYIQGSGHTTVVFSDHKNLTYFRTAQKLNDRQSRWSLYLSGFDIKLIHLPGTKMIQSDALSRQPDHGLDKQETEKTTMLPEGMFVNLLDLDLQQRILNRTEFDIDVKDAVEKILQDGPTALRNSLEDWKLEEIDGKRTIFYKGKNYIPKDQELRRDIVRMITKRQDTPENWRLTTRLNKTIGGQDYERSSRITFKAVEHANSLKLTDHRRTQLISQSKEQKTRDHSHIALWI
jgi:hypothetical protein